MSTVDRALAFIVNRYKGSGFLPSTKDVIAFADFADQDTADLRQQLQAAQRRVGELEAALRGISYAYTSSNPQVWTSAMEKVREALASAKEPQP